MNIGDIVEFAIYTDHPTLTASFKGKVIGVPTSEAMRNTLKVEVLSFVGNDGKKRRFYRKMIGEHLRISTSSIIAGAKNGA